MVDLARMLKHLLPPSWLLLRRAFPAQTLAAIEAAVTAAEQGHRGEIRFAVEASLNLPALLRKQSARARAVDVFAQLRVWDTAENNGVLIYVLLADHDVEIVADRGITARVSADEWSAICQAMETRFQVGQYEAGAVAAIARVGELLRRHYPGADAAGDELEDRPGVL